MYIVDSLNCGGYLRRGSGKLEISNEHRSGENIDCVWVISADEDKIVKLKITKLQLPNSGNCQQENLLVSRRIRNENTPMQYTAIFHGCKNDKFQLKF